MPSYIVKVNRNEDRYVLWSTVTDSPHFWGTEEELMAHMEYLGQVGDGINDRFLRADVFGTSSYGGDYSWDDSGFIFEQKGFLRRNKLGEFLDSWSDDAPFFNLSLLESFED